MALIGDFEHSLRPDQFAEFIHAQMAIRRQLLQAVRAQPGREVFLKPDRPLLGIKLARSFAPNESAALRQGKNQPNFLIRTL
ncbi:MAG: hypothetical protein U1F81_04490 [Verrucomicrobiaceae bacterium]